MPVRQLVEILSSTLGTFYLSILLEAEGVFSVDSVVRAWSESSQVQETLGASFCGG